VYFVLLPFADVVRRSFLDAMGNQFTGSRNYKNVLQNEAFRLAAGNTVKFMLVCIPVLLLLSLVCALLINQRKVYQEFFQNDIFISDGNSGGIGSAFVAVVFGPEWIF